MDSVRGQLLIAGPTLEDPNFWRTVVLVVEHSEEGALGLVLNRPSESTVAEAVPQLLELADADDDVLVGGPVGQSAVIVLADFEEPDEAALLAFDSVGVLAGGTDRPARRGCAPRPGLRRPLGLGPRPAGRTKSNAATGSSSQLGTAMPSHPSRPSSGRRCSSARAEATRWSRGCRRTRRSTQGGRLKFRRERVAGEGMAGVSGGRDVGLGDGVASLKCGDFGYPMALFLLPAVRWV